MAAIAETIVLLESCPLLRLFIIRSSFVVIYLSLFLCRCCDSMAISRRQYTRERKSSSVSAAPPYTSTWRTTLFKSMNHNRSTLAFLKVSNYNRRVGGDVEPSTTFFSLGTLIRRHRIALPAPDDDLFYTVKDFNIGQKLTLYGRVFSIVVKINTTHTLYWLAIKMYIVSMCFWWIIIVFFLRRIVMSSRGIF